MPYQSSFLRSMPSVRLAFLLGVCLSIVSRGLAASSPCIGVTQAGDTLTSVAQQFGYTIEEILTANPGGNPGDVLEIGASIYLPECDRFEVQAPAPAPAHPKVLPKQMVLPEPSPAKADGPLKKSVPALQGLDRVPLKTTELTHSLTDLASSLGFGEMADGLMPEGLAAGPAPSAFGTIADQEVLRLAHFMQPEAAQAKVPVAPLAQPEPAKDSSPVAKIAPMAAATFPVGTCTEDPGSHPAGCCSARKCCCPCG
eukprot:jgi/Botrbrau1/11230/Bobra.0038s0002.1